MKEYIGKVCLNYEYYSGEDLYSDGDIEDELLDIVEKHSASDFDEIIKEKNSWPVLYHLSKIRENIINWYNFKAESTILEIGAGCGAITGALVNQNCEVTAIDLSKRRSLINANRNREHSNLEIIVGNFNDIADNINRQFDYITLIGVFEYAQAYMGNEDAANTFLSKVKALLKPEGKLIIAIENQLGLKYFAGCKEDHVGKYFEGIEGYTNTNGVQTYSKKKLADILRENGFCDLDFYYPYPDYKLPNVIYSDKRLPKKGELTNNMRNYDADRLLLFDESKAFDTIIDAGLFPEFSNSFLVFANKDTV